MVLIIRMVGLSPLSLAVFPLPSMKVKTNGKVQFMHILLTITFCSVPLFYQHRVICKLIARRDVDLTAKLYYSSDVALLGYSLILAILRVFSMRKEAARVMVAAPLIAFVTTHILYLNFYQFDYGKPFYTSLRQ